MRQVPDYPDVRNKGFCVHCGGPNETVDHVPPKIFLDEPFPENLPVSPSCFGCNNGLSPDEEYLACLLECVVTGHVDLDKFQRTKIVHILTRNQRLADRLRKSKRKSGDRVIWDFEEDRIRRVLLKLARGHAAFELNEPRIFAPDGFSFKPLIAMTSSERDGFEGNTEAGLAVWPEVGSRAMNRLLIAGSDVCQHGWLVVQDDRYRYRTSQDRGLRVYFVIREYLACEVAWYSTTDGPKGRDNHDIDPPMEESRLANSRRREHRGVRYAAPPIRVYDLRKGVHIRRKRSNLGYQSASKDLLGELGECDAALEDEVTTPWLSQPCPRRHQPTDHLDRRRIPNAVP